jgi:pimeloyl-ACP methyl ester carboxylesterase
MASMARIREMSQLHTGRDGRMSPCHGDVDAVSNGMRSSRRGRVLTAILAVSMAGISEVLAQEAADDDPQPSTVRTTDGVQLTIWYYPAATEEPVATVLLLHDLEGSHQSLEALARSLQTAGCSVVAPDLRGHGQSLSQTLPNGRTEELSAPRLRKPDLEAIAASRGGRIREQAVFRGDIETTLLWIRRTARSDTRLDPERLCVVGSGLGGTLASLWTAADAAWPPVATGPQGGLVRGLALISPAYTVKGATLGPALQNPVLSRTTPLVILAGESDRDAARIFDQFKRFRPDGWFELGLDGKSSQAGKVADPKKDASVFLFRYATKDSGDALATAGTATFAPLLVDFFREQLSR